MLFSLSDSCLIDGVLLLKYFVLLTVVAFFGDFLICFDSILIVRISFSIARFFLYYFVDFVDFTGVFLRLNSLLLMNLPLSWILS